MKLTTVISLLFAVAGTATAAVAGIEPIYLRMGAMKKRDILGISRRHSPGDIDPPGGKNMSNSQAKHQLRTNLPPGWSKLDQTSGCPHKCCGSDNGNSCVSRGHSHLQAITILTIVYLVWLLSLGPK